LSSSYIRTPPIFVLVASVRIINGFSKFRGDKIGAQFNFSLRTSKAKFASSFYLKGTSFVVSSYKGLTI